MTGITSTHKNNMNSDIKMNIKIGEHIVPVTNNMFQLMKYFEEELTLN